ncbi:hypothetical protein [Rhodoferax aquaticus]|uniref:Transporter substrate-binding domain-containing protein n=1 Tax=Rhodoferax aquaticus TaxID=2527691 RepID=A0A515EKZ3_9BURK|nr:hypothetical protein [Rhodoferax aquaticus]QDL53326.1 hypothetical protein EXZ61_03570 [Rhodoferax aquaticus]
MRTRQWWVRLVFVLFSASAGAAEPMRYVYPPPEGGSDQRLVYYWELLEAALKVTSGKWGPYTLAISPVLMNADRSQILLSNSTEITLLVRTTSAERERVLLPVRIPLDKGLTGYRLFLIQQNTQEALNAVRTLDDLKPYRIGQGVAWVDAEILRNAGLTVETGSSYESLFKMLAVGRFELFSRGVNEIGKEQREHQPKYPEMVVEKSLMLHYPLPRYFFFSRTPQGERLAQRVAEGLEKLRQSGEFDRRYQGFKRAMLADLNLSGRRLFRIPNPTLPADTPLADTRLWDDLAQELKATKTNPAQ